MPSDRFLLQLWDKDAKLLTDWLPYAWDVVEEEELNVSHTLNFKYPMSDGRADSISYRKIVRLMDTEERAFLTGVSGVDAAAKTIDVPDVTGFSVGDYVLIFDDASAPSKSFVAKITAISDPTLTLSRMDFTPTAGVASGGGREYQEIEGDTYATWVGITYDNLISSGPFTTTTGSPVIRWTGKTFRVWDVRESRAEDGAGIKDVTCQALDYDLNDTRFVIDGRTDITFGLASVQSVNDRLVDPERIVDEVVTTQKRTATDFSNGWIKGTISSAFTDLVETDYSTTLSVDATSRTVTGTGTSFLSNTRSGSRLYTRNAGNPNNLNAIVDIVVSDTELTLKTLPRFTTTSGVIQTDPDERTFQFDTEGTLRAAIVKIVEVWEDETQVVHIGFNEDKSIDVTHVPIPNSSDPTGGMEVRVGKNLQSSSRKLDVSDFGNAIYPTGATSNWLGAQTDQSVIVGERPSAHYFHRNTRDKFRLETPTDISQLRWGDPLAIMHQPAEVNVRGWTNDRELLVDFSSTVPTIQTVSLVAGGSIPDGAVLYVRVSEVDANGVESAATAESTAPATGSTFNSIKVDFTATAGYTYRIYWTQDSGDYDKYRETTGSTDYTFTDIAPNNDKSGTPKDFDGTAYVNGMIYVRDFDTSGAGASVDLETGVGQLRTIERMTKVGHIDSTFANSYYYRVAVTHPWDVLPSWRYNVVVAKPQSIFLTPITGFGTFQKRLEIDGTNDFDSQENDPVTFPAQALARRFNGKMVDDDIGYHGLPDDTAGDAPGEFDVFKDHYADGLIQLMDTRGSSAVGGSVEADDTMGTGQFRRILHNSAGSRTQTNNTADDMEVWFESPGIGNTTYPRYEMTGPPQLVREYDDGEWTITASKVVSPVVGFKLTIQGLEVTRTTSTTFTDNGSEKYVQDTGSELDFSAITVGDEVWGIDSVGTEILVANVGFIDVANKRIWIDGGWIQGTASWNGGAQANDALPPRDDTVVVVRKPQPLFNHETSKGNMFAPILHRDSTGDGASPDTVQGHCYVAEADYTDVNGDTAAWGTGADSDVGGVEEGVGYALEVSTSQSGLGDNELYLLWDGASTTTHTAFDFKRVLLVRPNTFTWVSTLQAPFQYQAGDIAILMLAETGGPLTIGKRIGGQSYVYGVTGDLGEDFAYGGITNTSIPIKLGDSSRFEAGARIFVGTQAADLAVEFGTRRGDARFGQVREVESVTYGGDLSPTRPFDILKLTSPLDTLPQPGDRVEILSIQDASSISTYGRVERQTTHSDIVNPEELYRRTRRELRLRKDPVPRYEVSVLDYQFHNPDSRFEFDGAVVGNTYRIIDADFDVDATDFKLVKVERNYDKPLESRMTFDNHQKTLMRGFTLSTETRLRREATARRQAQYASDSPRCMYFDTASRRCRKVKPPNSFCNSDASSRDGRLRRDNSRLTMNDCRNFTPPDNAMMKFYGELDAQTFNLGDGESSITVSVDLDVMANPDPGSTQMQWHIEDKPKPVAFILDAFYLDDYGNRTYVSSTDLVATFVANDEGELTPNDSLFNTGGQVTITRAGDFDVSMVRDVHGTLVVMLPGSRA